MTLVELVEYILGSGAKDCTRVKETLRRGMLVSGATRFRWEGFEADDSETAGFLAALPGAEPERPFAPDRCGRIVLVTAKGRMELRTEEAKRRRWLQRRSFWDALLEIASSVPLTYAGYHFSEHTDRYRLALDHGATEALRAAATFLPDAALRRGVGGLRVESVEFHAGR